jgi:mRNA interferase MazF
MERFVKGDVVVVSFPFTNLSSSKRRPALVLAKSGPNDLLLSQLTSKSVADERAVEVGTTDFNTGGLNVSSNVRPNKLFTAEASMIAYKVGSLKPKKMAVVVAAINKLLIDRVIR